jgi:hypothetical protein
MSQQILDPAVESEPGLSYRSSRGRWVLAATVGGSAIAAFAHGRRLNYCLPVGTVTGRISQAVISLFAIASIVIVRYARSAVRV